MPVSHVIVASVVCWFDFIRACSQLTNEQTTLFLYVLLQGNANFSSFVFSRSDIHQLVSIESDIIWDERDSSLFSLSLSLSHLHSLSYGVRLWCSKGGCDFSPPPNQNSCPRYHSIGTLPLTGCSPAAPALWLWQPQFPSCLHVAHHPTHPQPGRLLQQVNTWKCMSIYVYTSVW